MEQEPSRPVSRRRNESRKKSQPQRIPWACTVIPRCTARTDLTSLNHTSGPDNSRFTQFTFSGLAGRERIYTRAGGLHEETWICSLQYTHSISLHIELGLFFRPCTYAILRISRLIQQCRCLSRIYPPVIPISISPHPIDE